MLLFIHITIAISSVIMASYTLVRSSRRILITSYGFIASTVLSGVALVVVSPVDIVRTCVVGVAFLTVTSVTTLVSTKKYTRLLKRTSDISI